jgi:hypothetical protein
VPAESIHDQIAAAVVAALDGIAAGATYHVTPDAVVGCDFFDDALLNAGKRTIYAVRATGEEFHREDTSSDGMAATMQAFVLLLQQYGGTLDPFNQPQLTRRRVVDRMVRDVLGKLLEDVQLGGLVENVFAEPARVDREREVDGWAVAEIQLVIAYAYSGTP